MRAKRSILELNGHESLLPILANVVGILIVAVVIIGQRVNLGILPDDDQTVTAELDARRAAAGSIEDEIHSLAGQIKRVHAAGAERYAQRAALAATVAAGEKDLAERAPRSMPKGASNLILPMPSRWPRRSWPRSKRRKARPSPSRASRFRFKTIPRPSATWSMARSCTTR